MSPLPAQRLTRARTVDRLVAALITGGGSLVLVAAALLVVFLLVECLPLLGNGSARGAGTARVGVAPLAAVEDEYRQSVMVVGRDAAVHVVRADGSSTAVAMTGAEPPLAEAVMDGAGRLVAVRDARSSVQVWSLRMRPSWKGQERTLEPVVRRVAELPPMAGGPLLAVAGGEGGASVLLAGERGAVVAVAGDAPRTVALPMTLPALAGTFTDNGAEAWVASSGELLLFALRGTSDGSAAPVEARAPLPARPTAMAMVLGGVTCLVGDEAGTVTGWQSVEGSMVGSRVLDPAAVFPGRGPVVRLATSQRDKTFLVLRGDSAELVHLTSRRRLFPLPEVPQGVVWIGFSPRRDGIVAVTAEPAVHRWSLSVPHPEATFSTLFLPVRYEGFAKPELVWQSTGGTSSFEPKLSLVPLVVGTFKGALYALLFSAPAGLAAALYVSQFAPRRLRLIAKPAIELMAALPSVVVGFLAALLLAPLLQRHVVAVLASLVALPAAVVGAAVLWETLPRSVRRRLPAAAELAAAGGAATGTVLLIFAGERVVTGALFGGDFLGWLAGHAGVTYDQRNAIVVGFALGFAVIPIIFTLAEDAFANVPPSLISASLALGATRWQAARTVAVPAASPGLFAAVMMGLGRAVGETMIVLMATGNTPLLSLSPFNGMRTMSACIAVELPEAPYGDTLYRVLILTALLLFAMTFVINTVAVTVSSRLRRRFGRLAA